MPSMTSMTASFATGSGTAEGIKASIEETFARIGLTTFTERLTGLNVDSTNVNRGIHRGLAALMKQQSPWLQVIHCFNHRVELALKDTFSTTSFSKIDEMLMKLYYLYQKSPKRLRELRELATAYGGIQKPTKATSTRWIEHKYKVIFSLEISRIMICKLLFIKYYRLLC